MPKATTAAVAPAPVAMAPAPMMSVAPGMPPPRLASMAAEFTQTGLANKFNGRVISVWYLPRMYKTGKKAHTYQLFMELNIQADDTSLGNNGIVTEYYKASSLNQWVPCRDIHQGANGEWVYVPAGSVNGQAVNLDIYMQLHEGKTGFPTGKQNQDGTPELAVLPPEDWKGWYAIPGAQNSTDNFGKGTKLAQFREELNRLEYTKKAPDIDGNDLRRWLVGVYGHFVRMPFKFEGGGAPADTEGKSIDTLCLVDILDLGPISGGQTVGQVQAPAAVFVAPAPIATQAPVAMAPMPAPAPATAPSVASRDDRAAIEAATNDIITKLVMAAGATGVPKANIGNPVFQGVNALGLNGATALVLANDNDWMEGDARTFAYDRAKGLAVPLG